jgi:actinorhodin biosynthesis protein ActVIA
LNLKALSPFAACVGLSLIAIGYAQQRAAKAPVLETALTAMDHVQLRQLMARYAWALDSGADNGYAFADLFTPDGELIRPDARGREQLAAVARGGPRGPAYRHHFAMNHVIQSSPQGVTGKQYVIGLDFDEGARAQAQSARGQTSQSVDQWAMVGIKGGEVSSTGGHYEDVYVKTAQGWRFKMREFIPSRSGSEPGPPPARATGSRASEPAPATSAVQTTDASAQSSTLTTLDYLEIERLVASYGHALDSGFGNGDNGLAYAQLFAPGGTFFSRGRPYSGEEQLAALARAQPHGDRYVRHYLTNHVIEPTPDGATGKEYLVVIDIGESGKQSSIYLGGYYEDVYVKTADGWRFKTRRSFGAAAGTPPAQ